MEIFYSNRKIEKILSSLTAMKNIFGPKDSLKLISLLKQFEYANSLEDIPSVPPPRRHKLSGDKKDCWGICFSDKNRIVVEPYGEFDIGDLSSIKCVKIIMVGDYH
ncbi:MAG: hypothetical protein JJE21_07030 [Spirochaetaceae bacterium]|nr:hypothetical protein [Spirochaetaceae bacterium]